MAVLPLVVLVCDVAIFGIDGERTTWVLLASVTLASLVFSSVLARRDQSRLKEIGLSVPTSPLIALVCPTVYLFVRGSRAWRETATGLRPAWLNLLVIVVVVALITGLPLTIAVVNALNSARAS